MKRVSYNLFYDTGYTIFYTILIVSILILIAQFIFRPDEPLLPPIIALNSIFIIVAIIIGLRPIIGLFTIPDVIYSNVDGKLFFYDKKTELKVSNIEKIYVNQIGFAQSYFIYYEVFFQENTTLLKKSKRILLVESYDIKYLFSLKKDLLKAFLKLGLDENRIKYKNYGLQQMIGLSDKNYDDE